MPSFVELLYADAPREAYEQVVRDAAASGAGEVELDVLRTERDVALRVRSQRERLRRREAELSALYETAQDLTAIRDVDPILQAIVRRARQLLGADITYLSLNDPERQDSFIRVTDGSVSSTFPSLRLPLGTGLLGLVAQTGVPYATDDYAGDERFVHRQVVDSAVADEGIRAILGVPLLLEGAVVGTLAAGHRSPRPFPPEEVALLQSFAAHASIALENARLFEHVRTAGEQLQLDSEAVARAAHAHDRLTRVLLEAGADDHDRVGGLTAVAQVVADVLGGAVWVLEPDGSVAAAAAPAGAPPDVDVAAALAQVAGTGRAVEVVTAQGTVWLAPAQAGPEHLATLLLHGPDAITAAERRTLERGAMVAALVLLFGRSLAEAEDRVRGEVLVDLLAGSSTLASVRERAHRHGADLGAPHVVVAARALDAASARTLAGRAARLAADHGGLAGRYEGDVVLLLPGQDAARIAREAHQRLADGLVVTLGASGPVGDGAGHRVTWLEARQCLTTLVALGREGEAVDPVGLGLSRLLLGATGPEELDGFVSHTIGAVVAYDARRRTDLLATLEAWYASGCSAAATGRLLHVHTNTVVQRLERVGRLLGDRWRDPERALEIQLALRLSRLRR